LLVLLLFLLGLILFRALEVLGVVRCFTNSRSLVPARVDVETVVLALAVTIAVALDSLLDGLLVLFLKLLLLAAGELLIDHFQELQQDHEGTDVVLLHRLGVLDVRSPGELEIGRWPELEQLKLQALSS